MSLAEGGWSSGLCDCCIEIDGSNRCPTAFFCTFCLVGCIAVDLDYRCCGSAGCALASLFGCTVGCCLGSAVCATPLRERVRSKYGIPGSCCSDFAAHVFCGPCALVQELREMRTRHAALMKTIAEKNRTAILTPKHRMQPNSVGAPLSSTPATTAAAAATTTITGLPTTTATASAAATALLMRGNSTGAGFGIGARGGVGAAGVSSNGFGLLLSPSRSGLRGPPGSPQRAFTGASRGSVVNAAPSSPFAAAAVTRTTTPARTSVLVAAAGAGDSTGTAAAAGVIGASAAGSVRRNKVAPFTPASPFLPAQPQELQTPQRQNPPQSLQPPAAAPRFVYEEDAARAAVAATAITTTTTTTTTALTAQSASNAGAVVADGSASAADGKRGDKEDDRGGNQQAPPPAVAVPALSFRAAHNTALLPSSSLGGETARNEAGVGTERLTQNATPPPAAPASALPFVRGHADLFATTDSGFGSVPPTPGRLAMTLDAGAVVLPTFNSTGDFDGHDVNGEVIPSSSSSGSSAPASSSASASASSSVSVAPLSPLPPPRDPSSAS